MDPVRTIRKSHLQIVTGIAIVIMFGISLLIAPFKAVYYTVAGMSIAHFISVSIERVFHEWNVPHSMLTFWWRYLPELDPNNPDAMQLTYLALLVLGLFAGVHFTTKGFNLRQRTKQVERREQERRWQEGLRE